MPSHFTRRTLLAASAAATLAASGLAQAQADTFRIGLIAPLTGPFASTGKQLEAAARLYIAKNGDTIAGKKVELIVKDDVGTLVALRARLRDEVLAEALPL